MVRDGIAQLETQAEFPARHEMLGGTIPVAACADGGGALIGTHGHVGDADAPT